MNCDTIDSILDDHRAARLGAAERRLVAAHLRECARCTEASAVHDALAGELIGEPRPGLFADAMQRVAEARTARPARVSRRVWFALAGAAALAVVAVTARYLGPISSAVTRMSRPSALSEQILEQLVQHPDDGSAARQVAAPALPATRFVAGRDYEVLPGAAVATAPGGKIEVVEFFMWECWPCYTFEPGLERWRAAAGDDVTLVRVPATFRPTAELHARAYFTAVALGKSDAMHAVFYEQIHERGNPLDSLSALAKLFASFGVARATFDEVFNSSDVDAQVQRAVALGREYNIQLTPSLVVAGRYSTSPSLAGAAIFDVVDELVRAEQARRAGGD